MLRWFASRVPVWRARSPSIRMMSVADCSPLGAQKPSCMTPCSARKKQRSEPHLESAIRGTNPAILHRAPNMIVWGVILRAQGPGGATAADARVHDLIAYLESIQEN